MIRQYVKKKDVGQKYLLIGSSVLINVGHCPVADILYVGHFPVADILYAAYQKMTLIRSSCESTSPYVLPFRRATLR
jgi:hypothetical protein